MTKLVYPNDGIYNKCQANLEKCVSELLSAVNSITTYPPSEFSYRDYMVNLRNELRGYYRTMNYINRVLKRSDAIYQRASDYLESSASRMVAPEITDRDRMII